MISKQEIKGKGNQVVGKVKEKAGEILNNPDLEAEGEVQNLKGKAQEDIGHARRKVGEVVKDVGDKIKGE